jgi:hypothetical protein
MRRLAITAAALTLIPVLTGAEAPAIPGPLCSAQAAPKTAPPETPPAGRLLAGYGSGGFAVRTRSAEAQRYFDNGMQLGHAFAHKASVAAFRQARRLDPSCAMCAWGEAWASGPTINYTVDAAAQKRLAVLAEEASALAKDGPELERRLTAALKLRYADGGGKGPGDLAFAKAMDAIAHDNPRSNELAVLAADAWMIPTYHQGGRANLDKAIALLAGALARNPKDTGAIHFYIHATEFNGEPARALPYALTLQALAPAASHLVHMPSHTYYWVGRYAGATASNLDAAAIDEANARRLKTAGGVWGLDYHAHNVTFGIAGALMDGDGASALRLSRAALARMGQLGGGDFMIARAYLAEGRYGSPAEVSHLPDPGPGRPFLRAMWRYARGEAAARRGDGAALKAELAQLKVAQPAELKDMSGLAPLQAAAMSQIAQLTLKGRAAMLARDWTGAAAAFGEAADIQEKRLVTMTDPPGWSFPVRRSLASARLAAGRPAEAAKEAEAALARAPADPMSLLVLARARQAQGQGAEARRRMQEARRGWLGGPLQIAAAGA